MWTIIQDAKRPKATKMHFLPYSDKYVVVNPSSRLLRLVVHKLIFLHEKMSRDICWVIT